MLLLSAFACVPSFNSLNNPKWWILLSSSLRLSLGVEPKCGCFVTPNLGLTSMPLHLWLARSGMEYDRKEKWRVERRWESWGGRALVACIQNAASSYLLTTTKLTKFRWVDKLVFQSRIIFLTGLWSVVSKYSLWICIKPVLNSCLNTICPASIYSCCCNQSVPREKLKALSQMPDTSLASTQRVVVTI